MTRRLLLVLLLFAVTNAACDYFVSTQERIARAERHFDAREYRAALIDVRTVLQREPANARARLLSARINFQFGNPGAARQDLERSLAAGTVPTAGTSILAARIRLALHDGEALLADIDRGKLMLAEPQRSLYRGEALLALGKADEAERTLRQALALDPKLTAAHLGLATIRASGDFDGALAELDAVLAYEPDSPEAWAARGNLYAAKGHYREAEQALVTAMAKDQGALMPPSAATTLALLTEVRLATGQVGAAAQSQADLAARAPGGLMTRFLSARIALVRREYTDAASTLHVLVNDFPDFAPAQRLLSVALIGQGNLLQAEEQLRSVLARWPGDSDARKLLAQVELRLEQPEKARETLAAAGAPDDTTTLLNLAEFDVRTGHGEVAEANLARAVKSDPSNVRARFALAQLAVRRGNLAQARTRLQELRAADAQAIEPRLLLAAIDLRSSQALEADAVIAEALVAASGRPDVSNAVGRLYLAAGRYDEALANFRAALDRDADKPAYWLDISRAQLALDQGEAARVSAERALTLQPDWIAAVEMLVRADVATGHAAAAVARATSQRVKFPKSAPAWLLEGEALLARKQYAEAAQSFDAAARLSPSALLASRLYQSRRLGRLPDETAPLAGWLKSHPRDELVRMLLADAYMTSAKPQEAIGEYEFIVKANARNLVALNNLAGLYEEAKDARALATARAAYDLAPKNVAIADTYGWIALHAGPTAEALKILQAAAAAAPAAGDIQYHYAAALSQSGDRAGARAVLRKTLAGGRPFTGRTEAEALLSSVESR